MHSELHNNFHTYKRETCVQTYRQYFFDCLLALSHVVFKCKHCIRLKQANNAIFHSYVTDAYVNTVSDC